MKDLSNIFTFNTEISYLNPSLLNIIDKYINLSVFQFDDEKFIPTVLKVLSE